MGLFGRHKKRWNKAFGSSSDGSAPPPVAPAVVIQDYPGVLSFSTTFGYRAVEGTTIRVQVDRLGGSVGASSVQYATDASVGPAAAVDGLDYIGQSGTLNWADGEAGPKFIDIVTIDNIGHDDGYRYFSARLHTPSGASPISGGRTTTCQVVDNDAPGVGPAYFRPASLGYKVVESGTSVTVEVVRGGSLNGAVSVDVDTSNGTALAGTHYTTATDTLTWAAGEGGAKQLVIPIINVGGAGGNKILYVDLSVPVEAVIDTGYEQIEIEIIDDESFIVTPGALRIQPAISIPENGVFTQVSVYRTGGTTGAVAVQYTLTDGTAVAGTDFVAGSGTLNWADGDSNPKNITFTVIDNALVRSDKACSIVLSGVTGGATLEVATCAITIIEDDRYSAMIDDSSMGLWEGAIVPSDGDFGYMQVSILARAIGIEVNGVLGPSAGQEGRGGSPDFIGGADGSLEATPTGRNNFQYA